jgi:hypothetical protein
MWSKTGVWIQFRMLSVVAPIMAATWIYNSASVASAALIQGTLSWLTNKLPGSAHNRR